MHSRLLVQFFFFNDTATTEIYTLSLHDALPIRRRRIARCRHRGAVSPPPLPRASRDRAPASGLDRACPCRSLPSGVAGSLDDRPLRDLTRGPHIRGAKTAVNKILARRTSRIRDELRSD